ASAAMDVSDGLAGDLAKLCRVSGVSADVQLEDVPLSAQARDLLAKGAVNVERLVSGGDDYELLCAVSPAAAERFVAAAKAAGTAATIIGAVRAGDEPPRFLDASGEPVALKRLSWSHF
ncbi:MAG: AIR synthase-related protein, partial [Pseudomonadota bacterium]